MIFFRADGNEKIGAGHIMRCLSIACVVREINEQVIFYTASNDFSMQIKEKFINNVVFGSDYMDMNSELDYFIDEIDTYKPRYIFVDSYFVTKEYLFDILKCSHTYGGKIVYIDDMMSFAYPCDYLINYNIYGPDMKSRYISMYLADGIEENSCDFPKLLLGLEFLPLRKEFTNIPLRVHNKLSKNVLISTGGADTEHVALEIVDAITLMPREDVGEYIFHIIIGPMNTDRMKIDELAKKCANIQTHFDVKDMVSLMMSCDVAISAAGSTLYELCITQTPTITYVVADNQILMAKSFFEKGIMDYVGDIRKNGRSKMAKELLSRAIELCNDVDCQMKLSKRQMSFMKNSCVDNIIQSLNMNE